MDNLIENNIKGNIINNVYNTINLDNRYIAKLINITIEEIPRNFSNQNNNNNVIQINKNSSF